MASKQTVSFVAKTTESSTLLASRHYGATRSRLSSRLPPLFLPYAHDDILKGNEVEYSFGKKNKRFRFSLFVFVSRSKNS